jgi:CBS domain containing-hemolysin-like protein
MLTFITLGLAVLLIALNALFVAAEFSFVKIRSTRMEILARGGNKRAKAALFGLAHLNSYLSVCQLGITLSSLGLGWLGEPVAAAILSPLFALLGLESPELIRSLSFIFGFSLITFSHVVFGELVPKTISIRAAEATVLLLARPMMAFYFLFLPAIKLLDTAAELAIRLMGCASLARDPAHSPDELKLIVAEARAKGLLDAD